MQRHTPQGVILACDFCGSDWDMQKPMIEGHKGSILCAECLSRAIDEAAQIDQRFSCTMCLVDREPSMKRWTHPDATVGSNPDAIICWDCIQQADRTFDKDPDTDWTRRIKPDAKWK